MGRSSSAPSKQSEGVLRSVGQASADQRIAVLVPCHNEAATITAVVRDFQRALPESAIYVFDNNSSDGTAAVAREAGALVRTVSDQGKGNVIRRMFADIEADVYVLVDGDGTYDAKAAPQLVQTLLAGGLDMVVGTRVSDEREAYRRGHRFGNRMLTRCVATLFGRTFTDMLSGYRAFSRRFVKSFPAHAAGFETETELTVHALELRMPVAELATAYGARPEGSASKLNTWGRWPADPADDREALQGGEAIAVFFSRFFCLHAPVPVAGHPGVR
ncbi:glycosyltransferase involved in cell wall biosynthesis [Paraburkholderia sp. 40]